MAEQDFLETFRQENIIDSVTLMEVWKKADKDGNGLIDSNELSNMLKSLGVADDKIPEMNKDIIRLYDTDNDGKLGLSELSNLLQSGQNILQAFIDGEELTKEKFDEIFQKYDKDCDGTVQGCELLAFLKDMRATQGNEDESIESLLHYKHWILKEADKNDDGKLTKDELLVLFFGDE